MVKFNDLKPLVNNFPTLEKLMTSMEGAGLVELSKVTKPYKTNYAKLTELGRGVAADLKRANDRMLGITTEAGTNCRPFVEEAVSVSNKETSD